MKDKIRKVFTLLILAASLVGLAYTLVLYAGRQMDGLQALFAIQTAMLSLLWFGFQLGETEGDWPLSIRPAVGVAATDPERKGAARKEGWTLCEQNAA
jgi:hypothetical protein